MHDARLGGFRGEWQRQRYRRNQVDPQDLHRGKWHGDAENNRNQNHEGLRAVCWKKKDKGLADIVEDSPSLFDSLLDGREVVIRKDDVRSLFCCFGALDSHSDTNVSPCDRGRVVNSVAGHCHNLSTRLECSNNADLVLWTGPRKHVHVMNALTELILAHRLNFAAGNRQGLRIVTIWRNSQLLRDRDRSASVVTRNHLDADTSVMRLFNSLDGLGTWRVNDSEQPKDGQTPQIVNAERLGIDSTPIFGGCAEDAQTMA